MDLAIENGDFPLSDSLPEGTFCFGIHHPYIIGPHLLYEGSNSGFGHLSEKRAAYSVNPTASIAGNSTPVPEIQSSG